MKSVTLTMTAEDARLLVWALNQTMFALNAHGCGEGVSALREHVLAQLATQGNPHQNTHVEREYRRMWRDFLYRKGVNSG